MRAFYFFLFAAIVVALLLRPIPSCAAPATGIYMVGDSITELGTDDLRDLGVTWDIDGLSGRPVDQLPAFLKARMAQKPAPKVVIVALGANAVAGWDEADYRSAIKLLPKTTKVILVTVYRDPAFDPNPDYRHDPAHSLAYTQDMQRIAQDRPHTCLVRWRRWASSHRDQLWSGVHPGLHGQKVWAQMVLSIEEACR